MTLLAAAEAKLICSRDSGDTWSEVLDVGDDTLTTVALSRTYAEDKTVLVGTSGGQVVLSRDGGTSWQRETVLSGETVVALTAHTVRGNLVVYAVTAQQTSEGAWQLVLRSEASWQALLTRVAEEPVAVLALFGEDRLLCAIGQDVLTLEKGEQVSECALEGGAPVSSLAAAGEALLAGTRLGVYRSTDGGRTWPCLSTDAGALAMYCASPDQAYVVSMGGRLWRLDLAPA